MCMVGGIRTATKNKRNGAIHAGTKLHSKYLFDL